MDIAKDGAWSVKGTGPISLMISGTYKWVDDATLEVSTQVFGKTVTKKYKPAVNGDKLTLTDMDGGKTDEYTRVQRRKRLALRTRAGPLQWRFAAVVNTSINRRL